MMEQFYIARLGAAVTYLCQRHASAPWYGTPIRRLDTSYRTCENCAHSTSTDPKCGLCAGPNSTITRWIKHDAITPQGIQ